MRIKGTQDLLQSFEQTIQTRERFVPLLRLEEKAWIFEYTTLGPTPPLNLFKS